MNNILQRPIAVLMFTIALIVLGIVALERIPTSLLPDLNIPQISIYSIEENLSAREIENSITRPLRQQLAQTRHLKNINSESHDGYSLIRMDFEYGTNTNLAYIEANEKIDMASNFLPKSIQRPKVIKAGASDIPVMYISVNLKEEFTKEKFLELSQLCELVFKRRIEQLPSVAMADMSGAMQGEVVVELNSEKIKAYNLSLDFFENLIVKNNIEPGNLVVQNGLYRYNIKFDNSLKDIKSIENLHFVKNGKIFKLGDFASVSMSNKSENGFVTLNDKRAVTFAVIKQSNARTSELVGELSSTVDNFKENYSELEFSITEDQTSLLTMSLDNLTSSLIIGSLLAIFIMFFFLKNPKSPLLIAISIPSSLLISILILYVFNFSINIISLSGLVLGMGMMIDNSIIVIDNITRKFSEGSTLLQSAADGSMEVFTPMLSSMLTSISVFLPLMFLSGLTGALFFDQAIAVSVGLSVSLLVSVILLPVYFVVLNKKTYKWEKWFKGLDVVSNIENYYQRGMEYFLKRKLLLISIAFMFIGLFILFSFVLKVEKLPKISSNQYELFVEWNSDISPTENSRRIKELKEKLDSTTLLKALVGHQDFVLNKEKPIEFNQTKIFLDLSNKQKELKIIDDYFAQYSEATFRIQRASNAFEQLFSDHLPKYRLKLSSHTSNQVPVESEYVVIDSVLNHNNYTSLTTLNNALFIEIDFEKINNYNVDYNSIIKELESVLDNNVVSQLKSTQRFYPIKLRYETQDFDYFLSTAKVKSTSSTNETILLPLKEFIVIKNRRSYNQINADNSGEFLSFKKSIDIDPESEISLIQSIFKNKYQLKMDGTWKELIDLEKDFVYILIVSFLLLYFILAAQFESFYMPIIVLLEIPIAVGASLLFLYLFGQNLNIMAGIGIVVMAGIVINDSILKIHTINSLRKNGMSIDQAIFEGGHQRLKPILMTSATTIFALLPFLFFEGIGAELQQPLAITVIGGLLVGTFMSLFFIPLVYKLIEELKLKLSI
jgi:multidrug efflux pump subunit AcrB